jgi:hypothetical protein
MITITIAKWEKFNARKDRANYTWLRLQNDFFHDQAVFNLSDQQRCLFLFLLCEASKKQTAEIRVLPAYVAAILKHAEADVEKNLMIIESFGLVICSRHDAGDTPPVVRTEAAEGPAVSPVTNERTNVTNVTDEHRARGAHAAASPLAGLVKAAVEEYERVLLHFKSPARQMGPADLTSMIERAVARYGLEMVRLAFLGARKQKPGKNFDPAQFVAVGTYLRHDRIERYANLGSGTDTDGTDWSKICQR